MKANAKYTVKELLKEAKLDDSQIGKVRVRVGGIPVNKPDHVVNIPPGTETLDVLVGTETKQVSFEGDADERGVSDDARASLDEEGQAIDATDEHREVVKEEKEDKSEKSK